MKNISRINTIFLCAGNGFFSSVSLSAATVYKGGIERHTLINWFTNSLFTFRYLSFSLSSLLCTVWSTRVVYTCYQVWLLGSLISDAPSCNLYNLDIAVINYQDGKINLLIYYARCTFMISRPCITCTGAECERKISRLRVTRNARHTYRVSGYGNRSCVRIIR